MDDDKDQDEVETKIARESDDELSDEQLSEVAGGSVSISYTQVATPYTQQK